MKSILSFILAYGFAVTLPFGHQDIPEQQIVRNNMIVRWELHQEHISFTIQTPTHGWMAIGFNDSDDLTGTYLIMGAVVNDSLVIQEHYTLGPGDYQPITALGEQKQIINADGHEYQSGTLVKFSLPLLKKSKFARDFCAGTAYHMLMAYSRSDEFQHHSMMRTSTKIKF